MLRYYFFVLKEYPLARYTVWEFALHDCFLSHAMYSIYRNVSEWVQELITLGFNRNVCTVFIACVWYGGGGLIRYGYKILCSCPFNPGRRYDIVSACLCMKLRNTPNIISRLINCRTETFNRNRNFKQDTSHLEIWRSTQEIAITISLNSVRWLYTDQTTILCVF